MWRTIRRWLRSRSSRRARLARLLTVRHFEGLSTAALEALADEMEEVDLPAGAELCREDELSGLLVIQCGTAGISIDSGDRRVLIYEIGAGDHVGALSLVGIPATYFVETLTPTTVLKLSESGFERAAQKFPDIRSKLEAEMALTEAIAAADALLPGEPSPEGEEDPRWQAIIEVAAYIESNPEKVWEFATRWGCHPQEDLREAIATCVLEHLLEQHFDQIFPEVERWAERSPNFADAVSRCWRFGRSELPENAQRLDSLLVRLGHKPAV